MLRHIGFGNRDGACSTQGEYCDRIMAGTTRLIHAIAHGLQAHGHGQALHGVVVFDRARDAMQPAQRAAGFLQVLITAPGFIKRFRHPAGKAIGRCVNLLGTAQITLDDFYCTDITADLCLNQVSDWHG